MQSNRMVWNILKDVEYSPWKVPRGAEELSSSRRRGGGGAEGGRRGAMLHEGGETGRDVGKDDHHILTNLGDMPLFVGSKCCWLN